MNKEHILSEINRTAQANGGVPLGRERFSQETGIKETELYGKYWVRWSDAIREAGFEPNRLQAAYSEEFLIEKFIGLVRELGRFPVSAELRMRARSDDSFPSHTVWATRFGSRHQLAARILDYCKGRAGYDDVLALCAPRVEHQKSEEPEIDASPVNSDATTKEGYVYLALLKLGRERRYKIGKAVLVERRRDQISLQLPEDLELVHTINTDDSYGIEEYWHKRFAAKNTKGEWFSLSHEDVQAFKRRKFM